MSIEKDYPASYLVLPTLPVSFSTAKERAALDGEEEEEEGKGDGINSLLLELRCSMLALAGGGGPAEALKIEERLRSYLAGSIKDSQLGSAFTIMHLTYLLAISELIFVRRTGTV